MDRQMKFVFVSYVNRSGSSFLLQHLSRINTFAVCPEAGCLVDILINGKNTGSIKDRLMKAIRQDMQLKYWKLTPDDINETMDQKSREGMLLHVLTLYRNQINSMADTIVFKHTSLFKLSNQLSDYADKIIFLNLIRDPRGIFASQKCTVNPYTGRAFNKNPLICAYTWKQLANQAVHRNPGYCRVETVRFEDLVVNPEKTVDDLLQLLQIGYRPEERNDTGNYFDRLPPLEAELHRDINNPADHSTVSAWKKKLKRSEIVLIEKHCSALMQYLLYEPSHTTSHPATIFLVEQYWKGRIFLGRDRY